jgi:hypothetical protein
MHFADGAAQLVRVDHASELLAGPLTPLGLGELRRPDLAADLLDALDAALDVAV